MFHPSFLRSILCSFSPLPFFLLFLDLPSFLLSGRKEGRKEGVSTKVKMKVGHLRPVVTGRWLCNCFLPFAVGNIYTAIVQLLQVRGTLPPSPSLLPRHLSIERERERDHSSSCYSSEVVRVTPLPALPHFSSWQFPPSMQIVVEQTPTGKTIKPWMSSRLIREAYNPVVIPIDQMPSRF